jgi:hypothetical protein
MSELTAKYYIFENKEESDYWTQGSKPTEVDLTRTTIKKYKMTS